METYLITMYEQPYNWYGRCMGTGKKVCFETKIDKEKVEWSDFYHIAKEKYPNLIYDNFYKVKSHLPNGWKKLEGTLTAPNGYYWASNGKSFFDKDYESALVRL